MSSGPSTLPAWASFACAGVAACVAEITTLPIDTAKVRLQLLRKYAEAAGGNGAAATKNLGMLSMVRQIAANEGVTALYKGFWPAIHRQLVFASLRVGLYGQISSYFRKPGQDTVDLSSKVLAGLASGAIGITVANPTDLVKVRFQSEGKLLPGQKPRYSGVLNAYSTIIKQEGLFGLWTGLGPAIARNSIINATELVTYDTSKQWLLGNKSFNLQDGFALHFTAAAMAGLMATLVGNPVDVVKTRVMAAASKGASSSASGSGSGSQPQYSGAFDCAFKTLKQEGPLAFYQGVGPQFFRITGWNIVMFVSLEQIKKHAAAAFASPSTTTAKKEGAGDS